MDESPYYEAELEQEGEQAYNPTRVVMYSQNMYINFQRLLNQLSFSVLTRNVAGCGYILFSLLNLSHASLSVLKTAPAIIRCSVVASVGI